MIKTLIATTLLATSAHAELCTFENLPAPTLDEGNGFYVGAVGNYEGFNFTSAYQTNNNVYSFLNNKWGYYDLVGGSGYFGWDEAIIGDRALFTPWGSNSGYNYRIGRNELWRLNSLEITSVYYNMTLVIEGYRYGQGVFTYTAPLSTAQRVKLLISDVYTGSLNNITEIKVYSVGAPTHLAIDNIDYTVVPAPSALALIGIAGLIGTSRRRR